MRREHHYFVYILASRSRTLYIGVTNSLLRRLREHREGKADTFTAKYNIHRLVHFERFNWVQQAIAREKYLKHMLRAEKIILIESSNPTWHDLAQQDLGSYSASEANHPLLEARVRDQREQRTCGTFSPRLLSSPETSLHPKPSAL